MAKSTTYRDAGVDIDAGDALVERIKPLAKATRRVGSMDDLGGFGALFDLKKTRYQDPILVSSTDGVGTKLKIAQEMGVHDTIGIDLVAMCVNDLVVQGAEPLFFLDYFATGKLDVSVAEHVIKGIAEGCKLAGCALVGGETAEMPSMYQKDEYDLAGFAVGVAERDKLLPRKNVQVGDVVLGLASSGLHSNGFSLVRHIIKKERLSLHAPAPFAKNLPLGEALLTPTRIYVKNCLAALKKFPKAVKAFAHVTGGGLTDNLERVIPQDMFLSTGGSSWQRPPVFDWLRDAGGVSESEMSRTFNCGIGMVVVVAEESAKKVQQHFIQKGEAVHWLGTMARRRPKKASRGKRKS